MGRRAFCFCDQRGQPFPPRPQGRLDYHPGSEEQGMLACSGHVPLTWTWPWLAAVMTLSQAAVG